MPIIGKDMPMVLLGACIGVSIAAGMRRLRLRVDTYPHGHLYSSRSIRQAVEHAFGGWPERDREPLWRVNGGWIDPFAKSYFEICPTEDLLLERRAQRDAAARSMLGRAQVVAVFLETIETWASPVTGSYFLELPHPDVFPTLGAVFHRLTSAEIREDLERIRVALAPTGAKLILAAAASWTHATVTRLDVRRASFDCIARTHAAVSEFVECHPETLYFPLSDIIHTAEHPIDFVGTDGRHLHPRANEYLLQQFLRCFADSAIDRPKLDLSWLRGPGEAEAAAPVAPHPPTPGLAQRFKSAIRPLVPEPILRRYREYFR
jgi:hypothetical protein